MGTIAGLIGPLYYLYNLCTCSDLEQTKKSIGLLRENWSTLVDETNSLKFRSKLKKNEFHKNFQIPLKFKHKFQLDLHSIQLGILIRITTLI